MKKLLLVLIALLLLHMPCFAQSGGQKVLIITQDTADGIGQLEFGMAIWRAIQLKKDGVDVRVIVEGESVLYFVSEKIRMEHINSGEIPNTVGEFNRNIQRFKAAIAGSVSTSSAAVLATGASDVPARHQRDVGPEPDLTSNPKFKLAGKIVNGADHLAALMKEFKGLKIPYTVCSMSAVILGVYDDLKVAGAPLSSDTDYPVFLSQYVKDNYQILVF